MDTLVKDLRFAIRQFRNSPGFTMAAVLMLALGIGATTAIFSFVDAVLLKPLPFSHAERILNVWEKPPGGDRNGISTLNFLDWKKQNTVFTAMAAQTRGSATLTGYDTPIELRNGRVSAPYFSIFAVQPLLGRTFAPDEDEPGKEFEVVLTNRIWQSRFGADPHIIGKKIELNAANYTVIGVLPPGQFDRGFEDIWTPLAFKPQEMTRDYHWMISWARLKPGVSLEQARAQMDAIGARIEHDYPKSNKGWGVTTERYQDHVVGDQMRKSLLVLLTAVGAVLLIACFNLANLLLVRGAGREREVAIRSAMGAPRIRLIRQFLTESVLLASVGGLVGIALGYFLMAALKAWLPPFFLPAVANVQLNNEVLWFALGVVALTGLLFGVMPAIHSARTDFANSLKEGGRGATSGVNRARLRNLLAVAEIAIAFVLLSGAGLLIRSFYLLEQVDPGFQSTNVITMHIPMSSERYPEGRSITNYVNQLLERVQAVPGVEQVTATSALPLQGWPDGMPFQIEGRPYVDVANRNAAGFKPVSPSYLATLGMHLKRGRWISETDTAGSPPVIVINQSFAERYFKTENPIGQRIRIEQIIPGQPALGPEIAWQIVGVVADEKAYSLAGTSQGLYISYKQSPSLNVSLAIRTAVEPDHVIKSVQSAIWQFNKAQSIDSLQTLEKIKSDSLGSERLRTILLGTFAVLALTLAAIGVYGVISYSVAQRTHEIGVRSALGAPRLAQLGLIFKNGMALTAVGLVIGAAGSIALMHLLASLLFGISPHDPVTLLAVGAILTAVAAAACYVPAQRAARVDPIIALRHE
jgi:putative ABC transport system permease protein